MPESNAEPRPESRLRRWWRGFHTAVENMDSSGHEYVTDRINHLEERLRRLEAAQASEQPQGLPASFGRNVP